MPRDMKYYLCPPKNLEEKLEELKKNQILRKLLTKNLTSIKNFISVCRSPEELYEFCIRITRKEPEARTLFNYLLRILEITSVRNERKICVVPSREELRSFPSRYYGMKHYRAKIIVEYLIEILKVELKRNSCVTISYLKSRLENRLVDHIEREVIDDLFKYLEKFSL